MKLLLIEDDPSVTSSLYNLLHSSYTIHSARDGQSGLDRYRSDNYDLVLLDLRLPDQPGLAVCQKIRRHSDYPPIIVISGIHDADQKTLLLESGANDYITKPFNAHELLARIRVQTRQPVGHTTIRRLQVGDLKIDTKKHMASRAGQPIVLRSKEYALLECLMLNAGQVVNNRILNDYVWDDVNPDANNVHVQISNLRQKIDRPFESPMIRTVHGVGYIIQKPTQKELV